MMISIYLNFPEYSHVPGHNLSHSGLWCRTESGQLTPTQPIKAGSALLTTAFNNRHEKACWSRESILKAWKTELYDLD